MCVYRADYRWEGTIDFCAAYLCLQNNSYILAQNKNEAILRSHFEKLGGSVELSTELVSLKQYDDHVEATIMKTEDGKKTVETKSYRWVVGADGGKSANVFSGSRLCDL